MYCGISAVFSVFIIVVDSVSLSILVEWCAVFLLSHFSCILLHSDYIFQIERLNCRILFTCGRNPANFAANHSHSLKQPGRYFLAGFDCDIMEIDEFRKM